MGPGTVRIPRPLYTPCTDGDGELRLARIGDLRPPFLHPIELAFGTQGHDPLDTVKSPRTLTICAEATGGAGHDEPGSWPRAAHGGTFGHISHTSAPATTRCSEGVSDVPDRKQNVVACACGACDSRGATALLLTVKSRERESRALPD